MVWLKWEVEIPQAQQLLLNVEIKLFSILSGAKLTNNSYLIYENLLLPYLIPLNFVHNYGKLEHYMQTLTQQLQGLKSGSNVELKTQVL